MIRRAFILLLLALAARAQTSYVGAVDWQTRSMDIDTIASGLWTNTIGGWFCFSAPPTNSTTYASGDSSRLRYTLEQANATARPSWSTNGMTFDGIDDRLYSVGAPTGMWYGIRCWLLLTNSVTATNEGRVIYSRRAPSGNQSMVGFGTQTGFLANETVMVMADAADSWRVAITNDLGVGWHHLVATWQTTNYSIYLDGVRRPHIYNVGTSAGVTNSLEYWVGGNLIATGAMLNATVDCFVLLTNSWTDSDIGRDYSNGLWRARP